LFLIGLFSLSETKKEIVTAHYTLRRTPYIAGWTVNRKICEEEGEFSQAYERAV